MDPPSLAYWHISVSPPSPCQSRPRGSRRNSGSPGSGPTQRSRSAASLANRPSFPSLTRAVDSLGDQPPSRSSKRDRGGRLRIATARATARRLTPRASATPGLTAPACELGHRNPPTADSEGSRSRTGSPQPHLADIFILKYRLGSPTRGNPGAYPMYRRGVQWPPGVACGRSVAEALGAAPALAVALGFMPIDPNPLPSGRIEV